MTTVQSMHITFELWGAIFCAVAALCIYETRRFKAEGPKRVIAMQLGNVVLLVSDALAWFYRGNTSALGWYMVRICNFLAFAMLYVMLILAVGSICYSIRFRTGREETGLSRAAYGLCCAGLLLLLLSRIFGFYYAFDAENRYFRTRFLWLHTAVCVAVLFLIMWLVLKNRRCYNRLEFIALFVAYALCPVIASLLQLFNYGISLVNIAITIALMILFVAYETSYAENVRRQTEELAETRIRIFQRQIQPHFMINCLCTIRASCEGGDTERAIRLTDAFSSFLRGSLSALSQTECVTMESELDTVRSYLRIEQERSDGALAVEYDIADTEYVLPAFTLQLLAENAVRHGVLPKKSGTIRIHSFRTEAEHIVEVIDDGAGFDPARIGTDGKTHIGLQNIRNRLALMCGGALELDSAPGAGTTARVRIPAERREAEP